MARLTDKQEKQLKTLQRLYREQNKTSSDDYKIREDFTLMHKLTALGLGLSVVASAVRLIIR